MAKYIDANKLKAEIERQIKERDLRMKMGTYISTSYIYEDLLDLITSLQQEQPEKSEKNCNGCPHCVDRKDQYGWHFKGCFGGPYNGKFIAEIDECPLKQEESNEIDLEKEVEKYFQGYWPGMETAEQCNTDMHFTPPAIMRLARHFYELGKTSKDES